MTAEPFGDSLASSDCVKLLILTPQEILFEGEARWVELPLYDGLIGIWPGHAPLVGALQEGTLRYETEGEIHELPVRSGILRVHKEGCAVLIGSLRRAADASVGEDKEALFGELEEALQESLSEEQAEELLKE